ncbi:serine/threonine protein kinase [Acidimicrobium ferrooxidans]|nr:serine/threonine protein kinase [Acidimicrobium ferrooxidans]
MFEAQEIVDSYRFKLTRKIAEGGMGTVYEALQYGTDGFTKRLAVKTLNREVSSDEEFVGMFVGEAKLVANLVHQNIVQIYQLGKSGQQFYIAMEYISGVNLQEFLDRHADLTRQVPVDTAAFIVSRICRGLEYAHQSTSADGNLLGVVHRDISPKNLMMTWEGVVKIADWGIAKARAFMTDREGDILLGKSQYMSPEQASFEQTDARSDLFSLGIVFYELLAGGPLFDDAETIVILDKVMNADVGPIRQHCPDLPTEIERILMRALARDRQGRYQTAKEMGDDLEHYMYDKGFGPTNQTLQAYLRETFPDKVPS